MISINFEKAGVAVTRLICIREMPRLKPQHEHQLP